MEINIIVRILVTSAVVLLLSLKAIGWVGSENRVLDLVILTAVTISSITLLASVFAFIWVLPVT